jgi:hypothetical protein
MIVFASGNLPETEKNKNQRHVTYLSKLIFVNFMKPFFTYKICVKNMKICKL